MNRAASPTRRIPALDGIRGLAILGVAALHLLLVAQSPIATSPGLQGTITWAVLGNVIDVFFIVSGFLVFLPMVRRGGVGSFSDYALGRISRVAPGYWLCLVVLFVLTTWLSFSPYIVSPNLGNIVVHLFALQMPVRSFDPSIPVGFGIDGGLWMISIIVGFYVVLPFIAGPYLRRPLAGLIAAAALTVLWKEALLHFPSPFESLSNGTAPAQNIPLIGVNQLPGWAFSFALGMSAAWAWENVSLERARAVILNRWFILAAVTVYLVCGYRYGHLAAETAAADSGTRARLRVFSSLGGSASRAALIAIVVLGPLWLRRPFEARAPRRLGELSYGLYLIHLPLAFYVLYLIDPPRDGSAFAVLAWFGLVLPVSLVYSQLSLTLIERPALRRMRQFRNHSEKVVFEPKRASLPTGSRR